MLKAVGFVLMLPANSFSDLFDLRHCLGLPSDDFVPGSIEGCVFVFISFCGRRSESVMI